MQRVIAGNSFREKTGDESLSHVPERQKCNL